ncbi:conserved protein of unknown function [Burkholderia multivorans]
MNDSLQNATPNETTRLTAPILRDDASLHFSAFRQGWGYAAFKLPVDVLCNMLRTPGATSEQILAGFEKNKERISDAIARLELHTDGKRVLLSASDF